MFETFRLPDHCTPTNAFLTKLSQHVGFCIPTPLAAISTLLGCLSIVSWFGAQLPQIYKNYQIKSTAGLSLGFLAEWLLGDATNLIGAILTHQAGWQVIVASYYVFVDFCLVLQFFWYSHLKTKFVNGSMHSADSTINDADEDVINSLSPINSSYTSNTGEDPKPTPVVVFKTSRSKPINTPRFSPVNYEKDRVSSPEEERFGGSMSGSWSVPASPRTVMYAATMGQFVAQAVAAPVHSEPGSIHLMSVVARSPTTAEFVGTIISWSSTFLYLGSRLPQLYKNWRRQSTAGLSPLLFFAAFCGNFFYTTSLLTNPRAWQSFGPHGGHGWVGSEGSERSAWVAGAAPFFLGAFGCLGLDVAIGVQFLLYEEGQEKVVKVRDARGFTRWEKVSGWMRGWIPSLAREKVVDLAESQRLLSESREIERLAQSGNYGTI